MSPEALFGGCFSSLPSASAAVGTRHPKEGCCAVPRGNSATTETKQVFSLATEAVPPIPLPSTVSPVIEVPTEIKPNGIVVMTERERRYGIGAGISGRGREPAIYVPGGLTDEH